MLPSQGPPGPGRGAHGPFPPHGGPPPYRPPFPPPRKRSKAPLIALIVIPTVLLLAACGIGGIVYLTQVQPKQELEKWSQELGSPTGMTLYNGDWVDGSHRYYALWRVICTTTTPCDDPTPVESVTQWLKDAGGTGIDEKTVADCYRSVTNCQRVLFRNGHKAVFTLDQSSVAGNQFDLEIELYWSN